LAPLRVDGVPVVAPGSEIEPCGRGARREGANISEFERLGVTGPVGVEPIAGAPRVVPGEVAPLVPVLVPEPVPPDPDV